LVRAVNVRKLATSMSKQINEYRLFEGYYTPVVLSRVNNYRIY
jgi:hypothetical protein